MNEVRYDVAVIGGGVSGVCTGVAAAVASKENVL